MCIATFRRPRLLARLLAAIAGQSRPPGLHVDVVVVDNDAGESARPVVEKARHGGLEVTYDVEPVQNISLARNRAVAHARGELILFVDDDEEPGPGWLEQLVAALERFDADVVFGPVLPEFAAPAPRWITESAYFNRRYPPTGTPVPTGGAGNCLVRRSLLDAVTGPFDPALGRCGGEDTFLFETLHRQGARLVVCREAVAREHIPTERLRLGWLARRALRTGSLYSRRQVALAEDPRRARVRLGARALAVLAVSTVRALVALRATTRARWALRGLSCAGQLVGLFDVPVRGY